MIRRNHLRSIPALLLVAFSGAAGAAGFQLLEQNASGIGNAYAGSAAVADNASTIFYNPAGMTQLQAHEFSAGLTAVNTSFKFNNGASSTGALSGNGGDGGGLGQVPNAYLSWALNKDLYLGLGLGAPFGLETKYDNPWAGAAQSRKFDVKTANINPSLAYRVNDKVALGFGVNYQKLDAEYVRTGATLGPGTGLTATLKLSDSAWGWNAGALFTLSPAMKVGVSYRSAVQYDTTGKLDVPGSAAATSDAKATIKLPDVFILSVAQTLGERWEILGDLSRTGWSSIPKVDIYRSSGAASGTIAQTLDTDFRNTWRVALGANYKLNDAWKLKFGIAYDQTPTKDAEHRLTSMPDNNRTWLSFGGQWKPGKASTVDLGAAYLFVKDAPINNNQSASGRGLVNGTYNDSAWLLGAQYSQAF